MNANRLEHGLTHLRTRLAVMCAAVDIAIEEACGALLLGDEYKAGSVVDGDAAINALENEIDDAALNILARHQPVAQDLRFVVASMRLGIDLERIGDEAASIAERTIILHGALPEQVTDAVACLMETAKSMYKRAVAVFLAADGPGALELCRTDDESTQLEVAALQRIMEYFCPDGKAGSGRKHAGMHGILICRSLNRICRRAANIAEHTYFIVEGVNVKHAAAGSLP